MSIKGVVKGYLRSMMLGMWVAVLGTVSVSGGATAAVVEFYNPDLDNFFITADPVEQDFVDSGAVGRWERTGEAFAAGGPALVCRFGGNGNINPATGTFFGPNSHFYTADPAECEGLKALFATSAKSWKFESNDFATTPAVNGTCPAGLVKIYRAYNNGFARGVDSNHRITSNHADYLQMVALGAIGEGIVMCAPAEPAPVATAVGTPVGNATTATIGAAGGVISTPDGKISVTIPAGALAADTLIGIQPSTNLAPSGFGEGYRLTPEGLTFLLPVTITFKYTDDDLNGTAVEALGAAFQRPDGIWQWAGDPTVDATARTISVSSTHFSYWATVRGLELLPPTETIGVNVNLAMQVKSCYRPLLTGLDPLAVLVSVCGPNQSFVASLSVDQWSVNGTRGGNSVVGTVHGNGSTAIYSSPSAVPTPDTVTVSVRVHQRSRGQSRQARLTSRITIKDRWIGRVFSTSPALTTDADVTWVFARSDNKVVTYIPSGTVKVALPGCVITPDTQPLDGMDGFLEIDFNNTPPTYKAYGAAAWVVTLQCGDSPPLPSQIPALYLGGPLPPRSEVAGTVEPDGKTIRGTSMVDVITWNWNFERQ